MMTIEANSPPSLATGSAKKPWSAPDIQIMDIREAGGANAGPLCDKHGSLSGTLGNDRCDTSTK